MEAMLPYLSQPLLFSFNFPLECRHYSLQIILNLTIGKAKVFYSQGVQLFFWNFVLEETPWSIVLLFVHFHNQSKGGEVKIHYIGGTILYWYIKFSPKEVFTRLLQRSFSECFRLLVLGRRYHLKIYIV